MEHKNNFLEKYENKTVNLLFLEKLCESELKSSSLIVKPENESRWIIKYLVGQDNYLIFGEIFLGQKLVDKIETIVFERVTLSKPLAYIFGTTDFCGLEIICEEPILIPRTDTESWVIKLIDELRKMFLLDESLKKKFTILDLCTGSGCIALALASAFPEINVIGADIDLRAINLAKKNAAHNNITNAKFVQSDLFSEINLSKVDLIVSNPPYVTKEEYLILEDEVKNWESHIALIAEDNGLFFYKKIINQANLIFCKKNKTNKLRLALEMSPAQINDVNLLLTDAGFSRFTIKDSLDCQRAIFAIY
jgi:release factor glutamine methyltransferase